MIEPKLRKIKVRLSGKMVSKEHARITQRPCARKKEQVKKKKFHRCVDHMPSHRKQAPRQGINSSKRRPQSILKAATKHRTMTSPKVTTKKEDKVEEGGGKEKKRKQKGYNTRREVFKRGRIRG
jgi:hypothetical protein